LAAAGASAAPRWTQVRTPHFTVLTDAGAGQGRDVARRFEQFRAVFARMTSDATAVGERPIVVLVAKDEKGLREILPSFWQTSKGVRPGGAFMRGLDRHYIVVRLDATDASAEAARELGLESNPWRLVYHEYVHSLLQAYDRLPLWLNEGLAEFYASSRIERDRVVMGMPAAEVIWYLRETTLMPLDVLLAVDHAAREYREEPRATLFYSQSWALVHYLRLGPARDRQLLKAYREQLDSGAAPIDAARAAFGDLGQLQAALSQYIQGRAFAHQAVAGSTAVDESGWTSREAGDADLDVHRARVHVEMGRWDDARTALERALAAAPTDPAPHDAEAWLEYRRGRHADSLAAAREAIAAGSTNPLTFYLAGSRVGGHLAAGDASAVGADRQALERSLALDGSFAPTLVALAELALDGRRPEDALDFATRAMQSAPSEPRGYAAAARALVQLDRIPEATRVARQALAVADGDERVRIQEVLATIERMTAPR
jgi:tetratricopeptide (TPR) repeat protein